ncbi:MAG TPA: hypothetical protein VK742_12695 [Candidatus Sulfotelmatobacter sp.]|nr:hypothetical protein [Candidatus Sulfotelmatobacter sp.]
MKKIILFAALLLAVNFCCASSGNFFEDGLAAADAGSFSDAADDFGKAVKQDVSYGALLNLGISEWQCGHAGPAILAWERAQWLDPLDSRAAQNLRFARETAQLDAPELRWYEKTSAWLPPDYWIWISGAGLWLMAGAFVLPRLLRRKKSGAQQFLIALGFCLFVFSAAANYGAASRAGIGFVLKKNTPLLLTPTSGAEVISTLNAGEPARVQRVFGNYFLIRTEFGLGWIERGRFDLINPR